jgi:hypothetical protein
MSLPYPLGGKGVSAEVDYDGSFCYAGIYPIKEDPMSKFVVCPDCEGEGTHGPGFVWTQDQIAEDYDGFVETQEMLRAGMFDEPCSWCKGQRVVPAVDEDGYTADEAYQAEIDYRAEVAAERRFGA